MFSLYDDLKEDNYKNKKNIKEKTYVKSFSEIVCGKTKKNFDHRPLKELIYNMQNT